MWTFNKLALVLLLILLSAAAHGDGISGSGIHGAMGDGIGVGGNGGFTGTAPVACGTGVINFSTGCTQGMFGGL